MTEFKIGDRVVVVHSCKESLIGHCGVVVHTYYHNRSCIVAFDDPSYHTKPNGRAMDNYLLKLAPKTHRRNA